MNIALRKSHTEWLQARVADGTFASLDDAFALLVEERMALEADDAMPDSDAELAELKESLDAARADVAAGNFLTLEELRARNAERLARLRGA
jgi:antitoxin ParD1/3/4